MVKNRCIRVDDDVWAYWQSEAVKSRLSIVRWLIEATGTLGMVPAKVPMQRITEFVPERTPVAVPLGGGVHKVEHPHDPLAALVGTGKIMTGSEVPKPVKRSRDADPSFYEDDLPAPEDFSE